MGSLTSLTEVGELDEKKDLSSSSSVSKVRFPTNDVNGGTSGTGTSLLGGPAKSPWVVSLCLLQGDCGQVLDEAIVEM